MRTKTLFLAAAALAAGLATSMAQNVYSVNIVGYVNVTNPATAYTLFANPLDNGTNDLYILLPGAPNGAKVYVLSGGTLLLTQKSGKGVWSPDFIIPPGNGFYYGNAAAGTNTFIGSSPTSNSVPLVAGTLYLAGSPIPFAGTLTDSGPNTINLGVLGLGSKVTVYSGGTTITSQKGAKGWSPNFNIGVAQGFFVTPTPTTNWVQVIQ